MNPFKKKKTEPESWSITITPFEGPEGLQVRSHHAGITLQDTVKILRAILADYEHLEKGEE